MNKVCDRVGYARVSTDEQHTDNQKIKLLAEGVAEICIFIDKGISGTVPARERPAFKRLLKYIEEHQGEVKYLLVYEISRLGRTTLETLNTIEYLEKDLGVRVWSLSPNEAFTRQTDESIRQLMLMLMGWVAQRERDNLVERTKAGLDRARMAGTQLGRPPVKIDGAKALKLKEEGKSWKEIAKTLGVPVMTLYRYRKRRKWDITPKPRKEKDAARAKENQGTRTDLGNNLPQKSAESQSDRETRRKRLPNWTPEGRELLGREVYGSKFV